MCVPGWPPKWAKKDSTPKGKQRKRCRLVCSFCRNWLPTQAGSGHPQAPTAVVTNSSSSSSGSNEILSIFERLLTPTCLTPYHKSSGSGRGSTPRDTLLNCRETDTEHVITVFDPALFIFQHFQRKYTHNLLPPWSMVK